MTNKTEISRPSILASFLWGWGIFIIGVTIYSMIGWRGWTENLNDLLLVTVAFTGGINAIATGALIDMHTIGHKKGPELLTRYWNVTKRALSITVMVTKNQKEGCFG